MTATIPIACGMFYLSRKWGGRLAREAEKRKEAERRKRNQEENEQLQWEIYDFRSKLRRKSRELSAAKASGIKELESQLQGIKLVVVESSGRQGLVISALEAQKKLLAEMREKKEPPQPPSVAQEERERQIQVPPEKLTFASRRLTTEDGRKARLSGREWQKWVADYIRKLAAGIANVVIETNFEKGKPDLVLRDPRTKKPIATGACKSYNLYPYQPGKHRSSQRTVDKLKGMSAESKFSERHKIPLFLAVVNQRTSVVWFHIVPYKELDSFERVTTPSWLAQDNPPQEEIERNHREFVEFLKSLV